jgi:hypothetical protein
MGLTPHHAKYFAHDLTRRASGGLDRLSMSLVDAAERDAEAARALSGRQGQLRWSNAEPLTADASATGHMAITFQLARPGESGHHPARPAGS